VLHAYHKHRDLKELDRLGLKRWWPFWAHLPYVNFAPCITPDLLHQIYKGIFKNHLVKWITQVAGKTKLDHQFAAMMRMQGMQHFKRGISTMKQWSGQESKEMGKQFLLIVANTLHEDLILLTCAVCNFIYYAHTAQMTESEVEDMERALVMIQSETLHS
jgi:hypothetical protein